MNRLHLIPVFGLVVAGCAKEQTPQEKAASDAAAVASVEAAQHRQPPVLDLTPDALTEEDLHRAGFSGGHCTFRPDGSIHPRPVLAIWAQKGLLKIDGRLAMLAADTGRTPLPHGGYSRYSGRANAVRLEVDGANLTQSGHWRGIVTITDQFERPVFQARGSFDCEV